MISTNQFFNTIQDIKSQYLEQLKDKANDSKIKTIAKIEKLLEKLLS
jgi:hypothetical protein